MIRYCIGVDVLNFPIYVIHNIPSIDINNQYSGSKIKQSKVNLKVKHYHMQHK